MQSVGINQKVISTANNLIGHDLTYLETNEARFPPTTPVSQWQENQYLEFEVPASSTEHDVFAESYFDVVWRPYLYVGPKQPRVVFNGTGGQLSVAAGNNAQPDRLGWNTTQQNVTDSTNPAEFLETPATTDLYKTGGARSEGWGSQYVKQDWTPYKLNLPPTSGFVPSQGFFHDLFSDFVTATKNTSDIRTIEANAGGFQYVSKILQILDSQHPRYGTAQINMVAETCARSIKPALYIPGVTNPKQDTQANRALFNYVKIRGDAVSTDPGIFPQSMAHLWVPGFDAAAGNNGRTPVLGDWGGGPSFMTNIYKDLWSNPYHLNDISGTVANVKKAQDDRISRVDDAPLFEANARRFSQYAIKSGAPVGFSVLTENDEWLHLSLTVGRENPDVYTWSCIDPYGWARGTVGSTGKIIPQVTDGIASYAPHKFADLYDSAMNNWARVEYTKGVLPEPPMASLFFLTGNLATDSLDSKASALYRNRQIVSQSRYYQRYFWSSVADSDLLYGTKVSIAGSNAVDDKQQWFRNAYRPKDGIFNIEYDVPAYAPKRFKIRLGNFAQAYCGSPVADFHQICPLVKYQMLEQYEDINGTFGDMINPLPGSEELAYSSIAHSYADGALLNSLSPLYNMNVNMDVAFGIEFQRFDLIVHRHKVSAEVEAAVRRSIMEEGLARYAVRRSVCNIKPLPAATHYDGVLFENTSADLVLVAVMRNLALNFNQSVADNQLQNYMTNNTGTGKALMGPGSATTYGKKVVGRYLYNSKWVDSLASAPGYSIRGQATQYANITNALQGSSEPILPWGAPSVPIDEMYLLINGMKEPNLGYQPDLLTQDQVTIGQDMIYKKVITELTNAGYPEACKVLPRSVWESNVHIFPFNLTRSKFAAKTQGSNLANKKHISISMRFNEVVPDNQYSLVAIAVTQATSLEMDASGNMNYLY